MSEPSHTPGPWAANGAEVLAAGRRVADCDDHRPYLRDAEGEANARLIAAAPDLLKMCVACLATLESYIHDAYDGTDSLAGRLAELDGIRTAIAKAEGRA